MSRKFVLEFSGNVYAYGSIVIEAETEEEARAMVDASDPRITWTAGDQIHEKEFEDVYEEGPT